jgi:hypothetical protein
MEPTKINLVEYRVLFGGYGRWIDITIDPMSMESTTA